MNKTTIHDLTENFLDSYFDVSSTLILMCAGECEKEALFLGGLNSMKLLPYKIFIVDPLYSVKHFLERAQKNLENNGIPLGRCRFVKFITEVPEKCDYMVSINYQLAYSFKDKDPNLEAQKQVIDNIKNVIKVIIY